MIKETKSFIRLHLKIHKNKLEKHRFASLPRDGAAGYIDPEGPHSGPTVKQNSKLLAQ